MDSSAAAFDANVSRRPRSGVCASADPALQALLERLVAASDEYRHEMRDYHHEMRLMEQRLTATIEGSVFFGAPIYDGDVFRVPTGEHKAEIEEEHFSMPVFDEEFVCDDVPIYDVYDDDMELQAEKVVAEIYFTANQTNREVFRVDAPPYGIDSPDHRATGRNLPDIISEHLGSELLLPYLSPHLDGEKIRIGVNFASAGVGILNDTGLIGCVPAELALHSPDSSGDREMQRAAEMWGGRDIFVGVNTQCISNDFIGDPKASDFATATEACCGQGRFNGMALCTVMYRLCNVRDKYVFWDAFHPTERANRLIVSQFMSGFVDFISPMNLSTVLTVNLPFKMRFGYNTSGMPLTCSMKCLTRPIKASTTGWVFLGAGGFTFDPGTAIDVFYTSQVQREPWPPAFPLEILHGCVMIRPLPWPSFSSSYVCSLGWDVNLDGQPQWALQFGHNINIDFAAIFVLVAVHTRVYIIAFEWTAQQTYGNMDYRGPVGIISANYQQQQLAVFQYNNLNATTDKHIIPMHCTASVLSSDIVVALKCSSLATQATALSWVIRGFIFDTGITMDICCSSGLEPWSPPLSVYSICSDIAIRLVPWPNFIMHIVLVSGYKRSVLRSSVDRVGVEDSLLFICNAKHQFLLGVLVGINDCFPWNIMFSPSPTQEMMCWYSVVLLLYSECGIDGAKVAAEIVCSAMCSNWQYAFDNAHYLVSELAIRGGHLCQFASVPGLMGIFLKVGKLCWEITWSISFLGAGLIREQVILWCFLRASAFGLIHMTDQGEKHDIIIAVDPGNLSDALCSGGRIHFSGFLASVSPEIAYEYSVVIMDLGNSKVRQFAYISSQESVVAKFCNSLESWPPLVLLSRSNNVTYPVLQLQSWSSIASFLATDWQMHRSYELHIKRWKFCDRETLKPWDPGIYFFQGSIVSCGIYWLSTNTTLHRHYLPWYVFASATDLVEVLESLLVVLMTFGSAGLFVSNHMQFLELSSGSVIHSVFNVTHLKKTVGRAQQLIVDLPSMPLHHKVRWSWLDRELAAREDFEVEFFWSWKPP